MDGGNWISCYFACCSGLILVGIVVWFRKQFFVKESNKSQWAHHRISPQTFVSRPSCCYAEFGRRLWEGQVLA